MLKNSNIISEVLELSSDEVDKITTNTELSDFNWDSLAMVNLITHISENFNVEIEFDSFDNILNFGQLDDFITERSFSMIYGTRKLCLT